MRADNTIDAYVRRLDRALAGPGRVKADLLEEARGSLVDAAEAYRGHGLAGAEAERRAVRDFGTVAELAPAYQAELAADAASRLALRVAAACVLIAAVSVLMWWGAPWTGTEPPAAYLTVATWVDRLTHALVPTGLLTYAWLRRASRRGRPVRPAAVRAVGAATAVMLGLSALGGVILYAWTVRLWDSALTWPPMLLGGLVLATTFTVLGRSATSCLAAARVPS